MRRTFLGGLAVAATMPGSAEPPRLAGDAISQTISGATLAIETPLGRVPVRYGGNGELSGEAGGAAAFFLGSTRDHGRWWIENDRLCHKWRRWFKSDTECLELARDGGQLRWRLENGRTGTATVIARSSEPAPSSPAARTEPQLAARNEAAAPRRDIALPAQPSPPPAPAAQLADRAPPRPQPQPQAQAVPPPRAASPLIFASFRVTGVAEADVLNVRQGPSADHAVVATLAPGTRGIRAAGICSETWCPVQHGGIIGWVSRRFLAFEAPVAGYASEARRPMLIAPPELVAEGVDRGR